MMLQPEMVGEATLILMAESVAPVTVKPSTLVMSVDRMLCDDRPAPRSYPISMAGPPPAALITVLSRPATPKSTTPAPRFRLSS